VENAKEKLEQLHKEGEAFAYATVGSKSQYGGLSDLSPDWTSWKIRVQHTVRQLFGEDSYAFGMLAVGLDEEIIGWDEPVFQKAKKQILGAIASTLTLLDELPAQKGGAAAPAALSNKVFVVHGHDEKAKTALEIMLREMGLIPVVLHRQADEGQTIIEKFEKHGDVGYVFVLLTPDEIAYLAKDANKPDEERTKEFRARPNVIFEFGYFVGRLGRGSVCCLHTGNVTLPSDVSGVIYKSFKDSIEEVGYAISKELKAFGYQLK
jgi:predicted nucleotide-binding protein